MSMYPSEYEYNSIVSQLDMFLSSPDVDTAFGWITNQKLKNMLKNHTQHSYVSNMTYWKQVVTDIKNAIFYTPGNIFYLQVQSMESPMEHVPPNAKTSNMIRYPLNSGDRYVVDIKNLSSAKYVKNLYIYPDGIVNSNGKVRPGSRHWAHTVQSPVDIKNMINSTTLRDGVRLFDIDKMSTCNHILLATETNDLVLKVEFQFHGNNQGETTTLHDPYNHAHFLLKQLRQMAT
jgi:hypothetical protein